MIAVCGPSAALSAVPGPQTAIMGRVSQCHLEEQIVLWARLACGIACWQSHY
jgi:hypothetical protein